MSSNPRVINIWILVAGAVFLAAFYIVLPQKKDTSPALIKLVELGLHKHPLKIVSVAELDINLNMGFPADGVFRNARRKRYLSSDTRGQFIDFLARAKYPISQKRHPLGEQPTVWEVTTEPGPFYLVIKVVFSPDGMQGPWVEVTSEGLNDTRLNYMPIYELAGQDAKDFIELLRKPSNSNNP